MTFIRRCTIALTLLACGWLAQPAAQERALPMKTDSVRFAVIGDQGSGSTQQYEVGTQMAAVHQKCPFTCVLTVGDNIYGSERPQDVVKKVEAPYKALLDADVLFYASLRNHDDPNQRLYKPYNMGGERYYSFTKGNVRFFALDSSAGKLRRGDINASPLTAVGFDSDNSFMLIEVAGSEMFFQGISRTGARIDKGIVVRRETAK